MSLFQAQHTWESVLVEIVQGLENGTVTLESHSSSDPPAEKSSRGWLVLLSVFVLGDVALMITSFFRPGTPALIAVLVYQLLLLIVVFWFGIHLAKRRAASKQVAADLKDLTDEVAAAVKEAAELGAVETVPYTRLVQLSHRLEAVEQHAQENAAL